MTEVVVDPPLELNDSDEYALISSICRESFEEFIKEFWEEVPGAGSLVWNWHIGVFAKELQTIAERVFKNLPKDYDLICNVSPGSSKSTVWSILFPAWVWTRMPHAKIITASHTDSLVLDLANKARNVILSEKYKRCFPEIELRDDQSAKGDYANTLGGERKSCTVGGKSPTGRHAHFILCLPYETLIQTDQGELPIGKIVEERLPVRVLAFDHKQNRLVYRNIEEYEKNPGRPLVRVGFSDGSFLEATGEHPVYVSGKGYISADKLTSGDEVIYVLGQNGHPKRLFELWKTTSRKANQDGGKVLQQPLQWDSCREGKVRSGSKSREGFLLRVRERVLQRSGKSGSVETRKNILFRQVLRCRVNRDRSSSLQQKRSRLFELWKKTKGTQRKQQKILQLLLQRGVFTRREKPASQTTSPNLLRNLWFRFRSDSLFQQKKILFEKVCERIPFDEDEGDRKLKLCSRKQFRSLPKRVQKTTEVHQEAGGVFLFPLRETSGRIENKEGCQRKAEHPSYRPRQTKQQRGKPRCALPPLSYGTTREHPSSLEIRTKVVKSVELDVRLPEAVYNIRVHQEHNYFAEDVLVHNCDDLLDPQKALSEAELITARTFMTQVLPSRKVRTTVDLAVTCLIMQRLGLGDPTDVMLETAKKEDAARVRKICLPAELSELVSPSELKSLYVDGLMDPIRLNRKVLREAYSHLGEYGFSAQFRQSPIALGGGMFKIHFFSGRVPSAPYHARRRIRYWDRASTPDGGCATAGVLMCQGFDGNFYIEHCVWGQWEPDERNKIMRAWAIRDRAKYGPKNEPVIYVEMEGGSVGKDAWKGVVRALSGFVIKEDKVTGDKDRRAEPLAVQFSAGNVKIVDNGESLGAGKADWDVEGFVQEFLLFKPDPTMKRGRRKDRVDASSGAFNLMAGAKAIAPLRCFSLNTPLKKGVLRIVACDEDSLQTLQIDDHPALLIHIVDPPRLEEMPSKTQLRDPNLPFGLITQEGEHILPEEDQPGPPVHLLGKLLDHLTVRFADLNPEDYTEAKHWSGPVMPWGLPLERLFIDKEVAKKIWCFLRKKRPVVPDLYIFVSQGGKRALSVAYGVCDGSRLPRGSTLYVPTDENNPHEGPPPCQHQADVVKSARSMVI